MSQPIQNPWGSGNFNFSSSKTQNGPQLNYGNKPTNGFNGGYQRTNPAAAIQPWQQQKQVQPWQQQQTQPWQNNNNNNNRWSNQQAWQQQTNTMQQAQQYGSHMYYQQGDLLPSYHEPEMFIDAEGNPTVRPTADQWMSRHAKRSAQIGLGHAMLHFGQGLVEAYLPWKNN